ncbi:MAG: tetratricopeptide repeat protein, partial [Flavobacteriales bacterium]
VLIYGLTLNNGYSVDDYLVSENLEMVNQGIAGIPEIVTSYYGKTDLGTPYAYRPVTRVTFAIERSLWGEKLWLSHLVNVLLYALLSFLLFKLMLRLIGSNHRTLLLIATALFVFHPIHTEVVCSLKNREELLSLILVLSSSILLIKFIDEGKLGLLFAAMLVFLISLPTKVGNVPFAGILVLAVFLFRKWNFKKLLFAGAPFLTVFAGYLVTVYHFFPLYLRREFTPEESPLMFVPSMWDRIPTGLGIIPHYLKMVSFPHPLAFFYGYNQIEIMNWSDALVWVGVALLFGLLVVFFISIKRSPIVSFGIGIFGMGIAPFLNIIAGVPGIIAERWLLTPSFGFCLVLAWLLHKAAKRFGGKPIAVGFTIILSLYSVRVVSRVPDWKSHKSLVYNDVKVVPNSFVANFLAGKFYSVEGYNATTEKKRKEYLQKSLFHYNALISIAENQAEYHLRCAYLSRDLNNSETAIRYASNAFNSRNGRISYGLKPLELMLELQEAEKGIKMSEELILEHSDKSAPHIFLGNFHLMRKDTLQAISAFNKALTYNDVDPNFAAYLSNLKAQTSK